MIRHIKPALGILALLTLLLGIAYPASVWAIGQTTFSNQANGSLVYVNATPVGSSLLAQSFHGAMWFHPRPSAVGYSGNASGASNLALGNPKLIIQIDKLATNYRRENGLANSTPIPADAATESGSGLDPDISVANAELQAPRVAHARSISLSTVDSLISRATTSSPSYFFGTKVVNVITLNLELKRLQMR